LESKKGPILFGGTIRAGAILAFTFLFVALIPPLVGPIFVILTPLPVLYYFSRLGRLQGVTVLFASYLAAFAILSFTGQSANQPLMFIICFSGWLFSEVLKQHVSVEKTFLLASSALFCCGAWTVLYHSFLAGIEPWRMVELRVAEIVQENIKLYGQLNIPEEQIKLIRDNAPQITHLLTGLFPALAFSGAVLTVWVNLLAGRQLFRINGIVFPDFGDLSAWKSPEKLVWILIAAGVMVLFPATEWVAIVGLNLLIICGLTYILHGLAIIAFFFRQKQVPLFFQWLFYTLFLVPLYMLVMLVIIIALGLFDLWIDFRKRIVGTEDIPS
jgi:uncharacterized protein YybS (DUF2232 family)